MSDGKIKKFVFTSKKQVNPGSRPTINHLEIYIPELAQATYSFYTWPAAPVLSHYLWEHRASLPHQRILELGSGTALPGILAAKCGAHVTLTDSQTLPKSLAHIERSCALNNLHPQSETSPEGGTVRVLGLTWGLFLNNVITLGPVDLILGSDCFYEPAVFEDIIATVSYVLEQNRGARFLCAYQERSSDWSIEHLLKKWGLSCRVLDIGHLGAESGVNVLDLTGDHTIHLLEIRREI